MLITAESDILRQLLKIKRANNIMDLKIKGDVSMAKRGGFPRGGMGGANINNLMKQAMKVQQDMEKAKEELADKSVEASSGGGAVKITATCDKVIKSVEISQDVVDPDDIEMLQELIMAAVNEALRKVDEEVQAALGKYTGGMGNIPGLF
jgi:DNA-binding YbaB/EbfC family protein